VKSKVSALMDGELDQQDASGMIESLRKDDDLQQEWETYHLIGDALRQSSRLSMDLSSSVSHKLESEPTVLSPHTSKIHNQQKHKVFAFATAASVIAMVSGWFIMTNLYGPQQSITVAERSKHEKSLTVVSPTMVSSPTLERNLPHPPVEMNDYLFVHREFSPGINMRGQVTNVNTLSEYHERYGR